MPERKGLQRNRLSEGRQPAAFRQAWDHIPEVASCHLLPRLVGLQRTKEMMFFGERIPAGRLLEMGLINDVLPNERLMPFVRETALKHAAQE